MVFEVAGREALRARLVEAAHGDPEVVAAALLGSAARGDEDRWSDIDLALRLAPGADLVRTAEAWTALVARTERVVDHLDLRASGALYRVLLLGSTLQVDLSFWPSDRFLAPGPPVTLLFGELGTDPAAEEAVEVRTVEDPTDHLRMAWLYALHARSALRRARTWQALWMLEAIRNRVVALCCARHGLPGVEGRGVDRLPPGVLAGLAGTLPASMDVPSLVDSLRSLVELLLDEAREQALPVPDDLRRVLAAVVDDAASG